MLIMSLIVASIDIMFVGIDFESRNIVLKRRYFLYLLFLSLIILLIQIIMFYLFPLTAGPTDMMGLVLILLFTTLILSIIIVTISNNKIKYLYPIIVAIVFIPTIYIYYNDSALIHSIWYLVTSLIGLIIGIILNKTIKLTKEK